MSDLAASGPSSLTPGTHPVFLPHGPPSTSLGLLGSQCSAPCTAQFHHFHQPGPVGSWSQEAAEPGWGGTQGGRGWLLRAQAMEATQERWQATSWSGPGGRVRTHHVRMGLCVHEALSAPPCTDLFPNSQLLYFFQSLCGVVSMSAGTAELAPSRIENVGGHLGKVHWMSRWWGHSPSSRSRSSPPRSGPSPLVISPSVDPRTVTALFHPQPDPTPFTFLPLN